MTGYLILVATAAGLGAWLPAPAGRTDLALAPRLMGGLAVLALALFFGNAVAGVPLTPLAYVAAAAAAGGLVRLAVEVRGCADRRALLAHPVPVFVVFVGAIVALRGEVGYLIWQWDEFARWSLWPKLIFLTDAYWLPSFRLDNIGYTPGWPLLVAYPSLVTGRYAEANAALLPFLMHLAVVGILFDVVRRALAGIAGLTRGRRWIVAWAVVLALLLVEAGWVLVPPLLASEKPQIYVLAASLGVTLLMRAVPAARTVYAAYFGLFLAFGYVVKVAILAFLPSALLLGLAILLWNHAGGAADGRAPATARLRDALLLVLPLLVVAATWSVIRPETSCYAAPAELLRGGPLSLLFGAKAADLAGRFFPAIGAYLAAYKLPLTLVGGAGIVAGLACRRSALVALMLVAFIAAYVGALFYFHLACFGDFYFRELNSIPRFTRIWLRLVHIFGPVFLVLAAAHWLSRRPAAAARRRDRRLWWAAGGAAAVLFAWQGVEIARALDTMATRARYRAQGGEAHYRTVTGVAREAAALARLIRRAGLADPPVVMIAQGSDGMPRNVANYHAVGERRGAPIFRYHLDRRFSWGETPGNPYMTAASAAELRKTFRAAAILWPYAVDRWMISVLAGLVDDPACRAAPDAYFLVRRADGGFDCVAKEAP